MRSFLLPSCAHATLLSLALLAACLAGYVLYAEKAGLVCLKQADAFSSATAADVNEAWSIYSCDFGILNVPKTELRLALAVR